MSVTRTPLCDVKVCPAPRDPDAHVCPHCMGTEIHHQHVDPKRMGGSPSRDVPENIVMICPWLHEEITLHRLSDAIIHLPWGESFYRVWDIHNNTVCQYAPYWIQGVRDGKESMAFGGGSDPVVSTDPVLEGNRFILTGASTATGVVNAEALTEYGAGTSMWSASRAPAPDYSLVAASPLVPATWPGSELGAAPRPLSLLEPLPPDLSYEEWEAWGVALGRMANVAAWRIGEWLAYGEERSWGQKYTNGIEVTGKSYSTLSSYVSVVKAFEDLPVSASLSMSVYQAIAPVARKDAEAGKALLLQAEEEHWTGDEAKRAVQALSGPVEEPETRTCDMGYQHRV